eukprot:TRINITY_DN4163_c0_g1_i2.p3 TRINITY_DN4163_c0_g1~~TRINITY_DN4163_c0_g1_i2.p3  ORF type:complete len:201 (+),score=53.10 TRINITY_DN4163_c0_g1_i2:769-1371(+)
MAVAAWLAVAACGVSYDVTPEFAATWGSAGCLESITRKVDGAQVLAAPVSAVTAAGDDLCGENGTVTVTSRTNTSFSFTAQTGKAVVEVALSTGYPTVIRNSITGDAGVSAVTFRMVSTDADTYHFAVDGEIEKALADAERSAAVLHVSNWYTGVAWAHPPLVAAAHTDFNASTSVVSVHPRSGGVAPALNFNVSFEVLI